MEPVVGLAPTISTLPKSRVNFLYLTGIIKYRTNGTRGSVVNYHFSRSVITDTLKLPTRQVMYEPYTGLFGIAPGRDCWFHFLDSVVVRLGLPSVFTPTIDSSSLWL